MNRHHKNAVIFAALTMFAYAMARFDVPSIVWTAVGSMATGAGVMSLLLAGQARRADREMELMLAMRDEAETDV